jgi:F-type H+-transporting ATPase subunit b
LELDWTTFVLEIINFLILLWLLKRFLYQPLLSVIKKRQQKIEDGLSHVAKEKEEAENQKRQYEARLTEWEQEKRAALDELGHQIELERSKRLMQLNNEVEQQRLKAQSRDQQQQTQWRAHAESEALQLGGAFAARVLKALSCPELDLHLQQLFIDQLAILPMSEIQRVIDNVGEGRPKIEVISAAELDDKRRQTIRQAVEEKLGVRDCRWQFHQNEDLIAGLSVSIGGWMMHANLRDELRFFAEAASHG